MTDPIKQTETIKPSDKDIKATPASSAELPGITPANTNDAPKVETRANDNAPVVVAPVSARPAVAPVTTEAPGVTPAATPAVSPAATPAAVAPEVAPAPEAAPAADAAAPKAPHHSRGRKVAMAAFNMAVGMGLSVGARTLATLGLAFVGAPALGIVLGSSVAVGAISTAWCHFRQNAALKKASQPTVPFFSKKNAKVFLFSSAFAAAGGLIGMALPKDWISSLAGYFHHAAAPAVAPVVAPHVLPAIIPPVEHAQVAAAVIAPVHCATPTEAFADLIKGHHVSPAVTDAIHRAASSNAHIANQGTKDMAYYAQNGFGGVPKDGHVATELFKQAADGGNVQAKVDLLYEQHWGLNHIAQDKAASLSAMKDISHNARADQFVKAWGGAGKTLPHVNFSTDTILKGVKLGCPTA